MPINTKTIQQLRQQTGAGLSDIKQALDESGGDVEKAIDILRKKGALKAAKKTSERSAEQGLIDSYIHSNGRDGALIEIRCETDFVARNEDFKALAHDIAMQIVASNAQYLKPEEVPAQVVEKEKDIRGDKDENLEKFYKEVCLLQQSYIKDDAITVQELIDQHIAKLGEKIEVVKFCHLSF